MVHYKTPQLSYSVILAKAGIHWAFCGNHLPSSIKIKMDSRLRENDGKEK